MLAKPTSRQVGAALVCFAGAAAMVAFELPLNLRHTLRWDSTMWLLSGCGALFLVRRLEAQLIARAILAFTALLVGLGTLHAGLSPTRTVMLLATAGPLLIARADGLDDDLGGRFRPLAHRGRILGAAAVSGVVAGLVGLFGLHFLDETQQLVRLHLPLQGWVWRTLALGTGFTASGLAMAAGFFAILRLRTFGLALLFAGDALAFALATRGHGHVKPILVFVVGAATFAQAALLWPFLTRATRRLVVG